MLKGIHFLLTYACNYECDHCFLHCGPSSEGVFTVAQLRDVLDEAARIVTIEEIYFEGGEPFLYYPLLLEGLRLARQQGFSTGVVTNCYWATAEEDARLWLDPLAAAGVNTLSLSDDTFHHTGEDESAAQRAARAAEALGMDAGAICIERPAVKPPTTAKGEPVVGGGALFKGRAVDTLVGGLPTKPAESLVECRHEELAEPERVHVDPFGHVHVCQGLSIGNMWQQPLSELLESYRPTEHPICGPLLRGGPHELASTYGIDVGKAFVDECHYCYLVRRALMDRFPELLAPRQVYGVQPDD